jgi:nicotinate-nucleotide--dimethylbenzimidazole phosphoribosyltransferase
MTDRRGSRFILEVLFLLALTVALTLANLRPLEIAGIMLIGWVIVAVLEWVAWREEPHYGSGLPPRYYVPQVSLPPAQPLEAVSAGYPEARDEAPTWIASPALRAEMLGDWPVAAPVASPPVSATGAEEPEVDADPWTRAEELPAAPLGELDPEPESEPEPEPEPEVQHQAEPEPIVAVVEQPPFIPPPVSVAVQPAAVEPEPEPIAPAAAAPEPEAVDPEPSLDVELARSAHGVARYSLDPLGDPQPRRRFGRGAATEPDGVEVPARPEGVRALPGRTNRQD